MNLLITFIISICIFNTFYGFNNNKYNYRRKITIDKNYQLESSKEGVIDQLQNSIQFYNTLTRRKEKFIPLDSKKVSFYSCGPTVYDYAHVGNFRAFLTYDLVKRWLSYCGYDVDHICNLTDVDDKIIIKMIAENKSLKEITEFYTTAFFEDLDALNIIRARSYPKATDHIKDIEEMISYLIKNDYAYIENGSVYFRVSSFNDYGKLANLKKNNTEVVDNNIQNTTNRVLQEGAGGSGPNERRGFSEKESSNDFALWKAFTSQDKEVSWDSEFGKGRPGWHIECSAMCNKLLGPSIDIHAGGVDLVFPHHQNEIAQSEAFSGKQFSRYWIHNGFVNINNEKMSKSLKNFKTLRDIMVKPIDARAFRFMVVTSQYRNALNFNDETINSATNSVKRIDKLMNNLDNIIKNENNWKDNNNNEIEISIDSCITEFEVAMSDDMNTPRAASALFKLINIAEKYININELDKNIIVRLINKIKEMDKVFGVLYEVNVEYLKGNNNNLTDIGTDGSCACSSSSTEETIAKVKLLADKRKELKINKQFKEADEVRSQITALGYGIKDTKDGYDIFIL